MEQPLFDAFQRVLQHNLRTKRKSGPYWQAFAFGPKGSDWQWNKEQMDADQVTILTALERCNPR